MRNFWEWSLLSFFYMGIVVAFQATGENDHRTHPAYPDDYPIYKSWPQFPRYKSQPRADIVAPNSKKEILQRIGTQLYFNNECEWVDQAGPSAKVVQEVDSFPCANCCQPNADRGSSDTCRSQIVCWGPIRCRQKKFVFYIDHVLCGSPSNSACPSAKYCALIGGALDLLGTQIYSSKSGTVHKLKPGDLKKPVRLPR